MQAPNDIIELKDSVVADFRIEGLNEQELPGTTTLLERAAIQSDQGRVDPASCGLSLDSETEQLPDSASCEDQAECRYSDRAKDASLLTVQWFNSAARKWMFLSPMDVFIEKNKPENRVLTDYWTERLSETQREHLTGTAQETTINPDEVSRGDAPLEVSLQVQHTTTNPVIPSSLAQIPCKTLGVDGLLRELNRVMRTSYVEDTPGLRPYLEQCIEHDYDFGIAFGRLRRFWYDDFTKLQTHLDELEQHDAQIRKDALDRERGLIKYTTLPRRVWDLYSNRVVPLWVPGKNNLEWHEQLWPISHSWMPEDQRHIVDTPINGHEWRVPMPTDVTLDCVRVELLNLGAEYAWLDILCLRQEDSSKPEKEDTRVEEWLLDVPTIGHVYHGNNHIVTYFEGLGRPFHVSDIRSPRHWLNRAWTLQETNVNSFVGGLTSGSPYPPPNVEDSGESVAQFYAAFDAIAKTRLQLGIIFPLIEAMLRRNACFDIDKIAGLAYLTYSDALPAYMRSKDDPDAQEKAWSHLVKTMTDFVLVQLVFLYPASGDGACTWRPTWRQLRSDALPHAAFDLTMWFTQRVWHRDSDPPKLAQAYILGPCTVHGLSQPDARGYCRRGTLSVQCAAATATEDADSANARQFAVRAHHQYPVQDDQEYVLVGFKHPGSQQGLKTDLTYWMVGTYTRAGTIRKVTVLEMEDENDRKTLRELKLASVQDSVSLI